MNVQYETRGTLRALALALLGSVAAGPAGAGDDVRVRTLASLPLEELMRVEVTTVLGTAQPRETAAAALHVVSGEDIRRSGHRTLADALRLVPGMFVGRINASSWVIGARGLSGSALTATRYLVLIDGRVVYDPLISATFWDTTDVPLADIDRIEVIRGPGATLWGANAMNGVVNVITKHARDTQGGYALVGGGDHERRYTTLRYGAALGSGAFRVFAKYAERDAFETMAGTPIDDAWSTFRTGFRFDGPLSERATVMLEGQVYEHPTARASVRLPVPGRHLQFRQDARDDDVSGAHLNGRVELAHEHGARTTVQAYAYDTRRDGARFGVSRSTFDLDLRHARRFGAHELIAGVAVDHTSDRVENGPVLIIDPARRSWATWNAFVQDTVALGERGSLTLGTKLTSHDFVGPQWQPGVRASFALSDTQFLRGAVSRPVRVPSRFEEDGLLVFSYVDTGLAAGRPATGTIVPVGVAGDDDLRAESMLAYELGHRAALGERVRLDTSVFLNDYRRLIGAPPGIFGTFTDAGSGRTRGFDVAATVDVTDRWRLEGSFSRIDVEVDGPIFDFEEGATPERMAQLRSHVALTDALELSAAAYYVDEIPRIPVDDYTRVDLGLIWRPTRSVELAVFGQNLAGSGHAEASGAEVPRSVYAQLTLRTRD